MNPRCRLAMVCTSQVFTKYDSSCSTYMCDLVIMRQSTVNVNKVYFNGLYTKMKQITVIL